ncbi:MAG: hypothetical protein LBV72_01665 [Tannerella sp.]|jgi:hypothetical protein|nr:hypothetical protein [Tannerella sp.]
MNIREKIKRNFSNDFEFPAGIGMLCDWIEQNPTDYFKSDFELIEIDEQTITSYFESDKFKNQIVLFAHSGNGGMFGIWKNKGKHSFIHLGSEGNEWYVLAKTPVDFLRLLAIGYSDVVGEDWSKAPAKSNDTKFVEWVETTFNVKIPKKGSEIADKSDRRLAKWVYETIQPAETFEHFDPDNPLSWESYYGKLKVEIISLPTDKKTFLSELRKLSSLDIGELMRQLKNLPFIILEEMCFIHGSRNIKNLPKYLATNLTNLKEAFPDNLKILFKEKSIADCTDYDKYPEGAKVKMPKTSDFKELK